MNTKYIFLDIDGTLVDYDRVMPESCEKALKMAQANGHKLIISTGRFKGQIYPWLLEKVDFDGIVTSCGANVYYNGKRVYEKFFTKEQLAHLSRCIESSGACFTGQTETNLVATKASIEGVHDLFESTGLARDEISGLIGEHIICDMASVDNCEKVMYYNGSIDHDTMRSLIGSEYTIDPFVFKTIAGNCGEISIAGISKASGIYELVVNHLHGSMEDTIAIGDSSNDITMVKGAHIGVAMGNAPDTLKSVADMVTDRIENDGIYNAFVRLGLI